jgi:hypothetical protein
VLHRLYRHVGRPDNARQRQDMDLGGAGPSQCPGTGFHVAPVVITSSTSNTRRPATRAGTGTLKAPSTLRRRPRAEAIAPWLSVARVRNRPSGSTAMPCSRPSRRASSAAWL